MALKRHVIINISISPTCSQPFNHRGHKATRRTNNPILKYHIYVLIAAMLYTSAIPLTGWAQDNVEEWLLNGRPECADRNETGATLHVARRIGTQSTAPIKARGIQHVPVVLVAFQDKDFIVGDSLVKDSTGNVLDIIKGTDEDVRTYYQLFCNGGQSGIRYTGHGSYGSVHDYFVEEKLSVRGMAYIYVMARLFNFWSSS